ncbi:tail fiber protein [Kaistella sp. DKR-2]|uniref:phage tail protein n=1 Tax=Kaistella soli TaxID=2849654 RepID=UPI001C27F704|nr:tail fiber protein [Kaistella soli]MBU8883156.1 tail fiber protein [Kaistella soli]
MKKIILSAVLFLSVTNLKAQGSEPFLGQIAFVPYNFAPRNWAECNGQLMSIAQNTALFSLLGTQYGGNGQTNFALPDMRGRVLIGDGSGPGLSPYTMGETGGEESHTLTINEMPAHNHQVNAVTAEGNQNIPTASLPANTKALDKEYSNAAANTQMSPLMINPAGGSQPHENRQPYLVLKCIIALQGIFPSRN